MFGCPRIALIISTTFGIEIDKDVVRRVLAKHYRSGLRGGGPSWLAVLGDTPDKLWSADLFRCESIVLKSHWVLVVMDQYTRSIIGSAVHAGDVDGIALCRMFNRIISGQQCPAYLSPDHDPLLLGWVSYYRRAQVRYTLEELDQWLRRKLRVILWRQWKRPRTRARELMRRGLAPERAWTNAMNGRGPWWNAGASHMNQAVPTRVLSQLGLMSLVHRARELRC